MSAVLATAVPSAWAGFVDAATGLAPANQDSPVPGVPAVGTDGNGFLAISCRQPAQGAPAGVVAVRPGASGATLGRSWSRRTPALTTVLGTGAVTVPAGQFTVPDLALVKLSNSVGGLLDTYELLASGVDTDGDTVDALADNCPAAAGAGWQ